MFSKKDWLMLAIAACVGMILIGVPVYFISKFVARSFVGGMPGTFKLNDASLEDMFSSELSMDSLVSSRGEPKQIFKKGSEAQLVQFLKTENADESAGLSDLSDWYTGKNLLDSAGSEYVPIKFNGLPSIENEVYVYSTKNLCVIDLVYFDAQKKVKSYFVGTISDCSPTLEY